MISCPLNGSLSLRYGPLPLNGSLSLRYGSLTLNGSLSLRYGYLPLNGSLSLRYGSLTLSGSLSLRYRSLTLSRSLSLRYRSLTLSRSYCRIRTELSGGSLTLNGISLSRRIDITASNLTLHRRHGSYGHLGVASVRAAPLRLSLCAFALDPYRSVCRAASDGGYRSFYGTAVNRRSSSIIVIHGGTSFFTWFPLL